MSYGIHQLANGGRRFAFAFVAALLLPIVSAAAEEAPAAAPAAAAPVAPTPGPGAPPAWLKVCGTNQTTKKQTCVVSQELRVEFGQPIAAVTLNPSPDPKKFGIGVVVPLGYILPPGIGLNIDGEKKGTAGFVICIPGQQKDPAACIAQASVDDAFIAAMKKGKQLELMITTTQGKTVPVAMTLAGFAKVYDGPGIDQAAAEGVREELAKGLNEAADKRRQQLIEQQQKEGAAPQN